MNIREGMRRVGILLGAAGALVGGAVAFSQSQTVWGLRARHRRFEAVMATPTMQKVAKSVSTRASQAQPVPDPPTGYTLDPKPTRGGGLPPDAVPAGKFVPPRLDQWEGAAREFDPVATEDVDGGECLLNAHPLLKGNSDGINKVHVDAAKLVTSIDLSTGEWVPRVDSPHLTAYLLLLLYPVIGFLLPWGGIRILTWVGIGFAAPRG